MWPGDNYFSFVICTCRVRRPRLVQEVVREEKGKTKRIMRDKFKVLDAREVHHARAYNPKTYRLINSWTLMKVSRQCTQHKRFDISMGNSTRNNTMPHKHDSQNFFFRLGNVKLRKKKKKLSNINSSCFPIRMIQFNFISKVNTLSLSE